MRFEMAVAVVSVLVPLLLIFGVAYVVLGGLAMEGFPVLWGTFVGWVGGYYVAMRHRVSQSEEGAK